VSIIWRRGAAIPRDLRRGSTWACSVVAHGAVPVSGYRFAGCFILKFGSCAKMIKDGKFEHRHYVGIWLGLNPGPGLTKIVLEDPHQLRIYLSGRAVLGDLKGLSDRHLDRPGHFLGDLQRRDVLLRPPSRGTSAGADSLRADSDEDCPGGGARTCDRNLRLLDRTGAS
jgi:hypothetical protein